MIGISIAHMLCQYEIILLCRLHPLKVSSSLFSFFQNVIIVILYLAVFRLEVVLLLIVYLAYGYNEGGTVSYILLTVSSWFMALSWLFAPYLFNPSGFEWQK